MDDELYDEIVHFYSASENEAKYPDRIIRLGPVERNNKKSNFRQIAKNYYLVDGILMKGGSEVLVKSRLADVLHTYHDDPITGGHTGRDKTYEKIKELYYWRGMLSHISKYVQNCEKCSSVNSKMTGIRKASSPDSIDVPSKVWSLVDIELIGPLPETPNRKKYIAAATDRFSKWSEAGAIQDKTVECVAIFLFNVICRLGCMDTIISDQGEEFNNKILDKLSDLFQAQHKITSVYHSLKWTGEHDNRALIEALTKLSSDHGDDWENHIPGALLSYHTTMHVSTNCTPFEAMYGRKAKLPLNNKLSVDISGDTVGVKD